LFVVFGISELICLGAKRIELYRIFIVEMNDWRRTNVGRRIALIGEADSTVATYSSSISWRKDPGGRSETYCREPPGDDASSAIPSILGAWPERIAAGTSGRHEEGSENLSWGAE